MEEEASREEGTDFSKGKNDKQKTTKRRPRFIWSVQIGLKGSCWRHDLKLCSSTKGQHTVNV